MSETKDTSPGSRLSGKIPGPDATLRTVLRDKRAWIDGSVTPLLFLGINALWGLVPAVIVAAAWGISLVVFRLVRKEKFSYAVGGLVGMAVALVIALRTGRASMYFLPSVLFGGLYGAIALTSVLLRKPASLYLARVVEGKPDEWYRIPRVRSTHMAVTAAWGLFLMGRSGIRYYLISIDSEAGLAATFVALGLPATAALAIGSWGFLRHRLKSVPFAEMTASE